MREIAELLGAWNSFYVMIGSSSAALTGLMFVVITLVGNQKRGATEAGVSTFSTPTVFHFCSVLFTAAFMAAPFHSLVPLAILLSLGGVAGIVNVAGVARRTVKLESYQPDAEDWIWHVLLPLAAYAAMLLGAIALRAQPSLALYAPAAAVTLLIFVGIHNAWDVVTFLLLSNDEAAPEPEGELAALDRGTR